MAETGDEELLWLAIIGMGEECPDDGRCPVLGGRSWLGVVASRGGEMGSLLMFMPGWWLVVTDRVAAAEEVREDDRVL